MRTFRWWLLFLMMTQALGAWAQGETSAQDLDAQNKVLLESIDNAKKGMQDLAATSASKDLQTKQITSTLWVTAMPWICVGILVFALFYFTVLAILFARNIISSDALRFFILPLVILSAVFLIVAGYSDQQIAPAYGLLGAIAGYLFGQTQNANRKAESNSKESS